MEYSTLAHYLAMNDPIYNSLVYLPLVQNPFYKCVFEWGENFEENFPDFVENELPNDFRDSIG